MCIAAWRGKRQPETLKGQGRLSDHWQLSHAHAGAFQRVTKHLLTTHLKTNPSAITRRRYRSPEMASESTQTQQINISDLEVPQLIEVRRQLEEVRRTCEFLTISQSLALFLFQELTHLSSSFSQLKQAQAKFKACMDNVKEIKPQNQGISRPALQGERQLTHCR